MSLKIKKRFNIPEISSEMIKSRLHTYYLSFQEIMTYPEVFASIHYI